ncbi:hypothetical protein Tco_1263868 [Tanacetum coccineum]
MHNANEGNAEDDDVAHVLDDDDDVVVSDDDEVNPRSTTCGIAVCSPPQTAQLARTASAEDKVVMGTNVYTVGGREVKLGLPIEMRILWRKNKQLIKADHFTRYGSAEEARNHLPPNKVWGDRTEDEWNNLVDWWSHPDRVARSLQNAANRAKNTIQIPSREEIIRARQERIYALARRWGVLRTKKTGKRYGKGDTLDMKRMPDQESYGGVVSQLPAARGPHAFPDAISREELGRIIEAKKIKRPSCLLRRKQTREVAATCEIR